MFYNSTFPQLYNSTFAVSFRSYGRAEGVLQQVVRACNKVMILHEDSLTGGIGAEISAYLSQHLFQYLDAPVIRVAGMDTPIPFASNLEKQYLPWQRMESEMKKLLAY